MFCLESGVVGAGEAIRNVAAAVRAELVEAGVQGFDKLSLNGCSMENALFI
jgi:hypothetical protein